MAQQFKEKAHLNIDQEKYKSNWEKIFNKKKDKREEKTICADCRQDIGFGLEPCPNCGSMEDLIVPKE